jgi:hypothetical protein
MKTGNKNHRTFNGLLRTVAVLIGVALFSFTVSAQNFLNELLSYSGFGEKALILVDENNNEDASAVNDEAFAVEEETEAPLNIENWMRNSNYFNPTSIVSQVNKEESLEIESWMVNDDFYISRYAAQGEEELALEAWMCDPQFFNN